MIIKKQHIINVLNWLIANNSLYKNIEINYCLFNAWDNKFIPSNIISNIVNCNFNYYKYLGYIANICKNNYKNNYYTGITDTNIQKNHLYSSCIYININDRKQNLILQLLSVIDNI